MLGIKFLRDIFGEAVALDLGTVNTLAAIRGRGIVRRSMKFYRLSKTSMSAPVRSPRLIGRDRLQ